MPKRIPEGEFDAIEEAVKRFPEGAGVDEILPVLSFKTSKRTLQRRLADLVDKERLVAEGAGRGRIYRLPPKKPTISPQTVEPPVEKVMIEDESYIPISTEGEAIKRAVRKPVQDREPVSYNREFLEDYRPNETFYLSEEARRHLLEIGRSEEGHRPAGTYARRIFNRLLIDLSFNSSRLEGNTYSLLETERLLEMGEEAEGKDARDAQMILNHKAAIELLVMGRRLSTW
ncbi:MAG: hypothetical protein H6752_02100 [Candidatus Omnitrophica bacterium]|nr:hypothetical protein [Candidatus Omnitrophota bacterium]